MNLTSIFPTKNNFFKRSIGIVAVNSGILAWFFFFVVYSQELFLAPTTTLQHISEAFFLGFGGIFAIIGSVVSQRFNRNKLLFFSITLAIISTASILLVQGTSFILLTSIILGISLGLGYPVSAILILSKSIDDERGKISGFIILLTFILIVSGIILITIFEENLFLLIILLMVIRSISYVALRTKDKEILNRMSGKDQRNLSWSSVLRIREFKLYMFPWIMFNVASGLASFVTLGLSDLPNYAPYISLATPIRYAATAFFGIVVGILADRIGRKKPIIVSLIALGFSFSFLAFVPSPETVFIYLTISGAAWGMLMVLYLALLGDLSRMYKSSGEKLYALGSFIPLIIYMFLPPIPQMLNITLPATILPAILSMIMFVSIMPVYNAADTLAESTKKSRKMKDYTEKVGKIIQESKR